MAKYKVTQLGCVLRNEKREPNELAVGCVVELSDSKAKVWANKIEPYVEPPKVEAPKAKAPQAKK